MVLNVLSKHSLKNIISVIKKRKEKHSKMNPDHVVHLYTSLESQLLDWELWRAPVIQLPGGRC